MEQSTPPSAGIYDLLGWFETNKKRVAMMAGGLAVVAVIGGFVVWQRGQRRVDAELALSSIHMPFAPSEPIAPGTGDKLAQIAEEFEGTSAAAKATLRAGAAYFAENNFAKAQEQFEKLLRGYAESEWVPSAVYGLAAVAEAQGKLPEAITKYDDFTKTHPHDPAVDQAKLNIARLYEQTKQPSLALETLKKMTEGQAGMTPAAQEAQERMRALFSKHPELLPPPTPSALQNMFSNLPPRLATNILSLTNRPGTNAAAVTGAAPKILLTPGTQNPPAKQP